MMWDNIERCLILENVDRCVLLYIEECLVLAMSENADCWGILKIVLLGQCARVLQFWKILENVVGNVESVG
jgi:hypothetical protein